MPVTAMTVWSLRAMTSSTGTTPGRTSRGGPTQAGGLMTTAGAKPVGVMSGDSKKLMATLYQSLIHTF